MEQSPQFLVVKYVPSGIKGVMDEVMTSDIAKNRSTNAEKLEFRILTPAFYSRFVHYAHDFEGIFNELTENKTIWVDNAALLPGVFLKKGSPPLHCQSVVDFVWFKLIQKLRTPPEKIIRPLTSAEQPAIATTTAIDVRGFRMSSMDAFVLQYPDTKLRRKYKTVVLRLFLANRLFFGNAEILSLVESVLRIWVAWALSTRSIYLLSYVWKR